MTPEQITAEYERREGAMKAKLRGDFDPPAIVTEMVKELGLSREEIVAADP